MATKYQGEEHRAQSNWHLEKKVTVSVILAIFAIVINGIWAVIDIRQNVALLQAEMIGVHQKTAALENQDKDNLSTVSGQYIRLETKLDRLIERGGK